MSLRRTATPIPKGEGRIRDEIIESIEDAAGAGPDADLGRLSKLVGTWTVSGGAVGTVTFEWMDGGFFLVQRVDLEQLGRPVTGIELIGHDRNFGAPPSVDIRSCFYASFGNTLQSVYEIEDDTLTIWGGEKGSPAYFRGTFAPDGSTLSGNWVYPGGGYQSTMTRLGGGWHPLTEVALRPSSANVFPRAARVASVGAAGFAALLAALHVVRSDVDPSWHFISEYAIGRHGWLMVLAFLSLASSVVALAVALRLHLRTISGPIGQALLVVSAIGLVVAAIFTTDPITAAHADMTTHGRLHNIGGTLGIAMPFAAATVTWTLPPPSRLGRCPPPAHLGDLAGADRLRRVVRVFGGDGFAERRTVRARYVGGMAEPGRSLPLLRLADDRDEPGCPRRSTFHANEARERTNASATAGYHAAAETP